MRTQRKFSSNTHIVYVSFVVMCWKRQVHVSQKRQDSYAQGEGKQPSLKRQREKGQWTGGVGEGEFCFQKRVILMFARSEAA